MGDDIRYILALDSAVNGCGVCVYDCKSPDKSYTTIEPMSRGQAECLIPLVEATVKGSGLNFADIDLFATTIGPGTFTGLRVGLSAAKSYALALGKPLVGATTLQVLAAQYYKNATQPLCVLIESKRQDFYCQFFDGGKPEGKAQALGVEDILNIMRKKKYTIIGDGCVRFMSETSVDVEYLKGFENPDPLVLAELAFSQYKAGDIDGKIQPLYLRGADVSQPKNQPRALESSNK